MGNWIEEAMVNWNLSEVELNPPACISEIESTESALAFKFPDDFKKLYLLVNGFNNWDMLNAGFSFWPLDRVIEEFNEDRDSLFVGFSDWLIRCTTFGFMRGTPGVFKCHVVDVNSRPQSSGTIIFPKNSYGDPTQCLLVTDKIAETFEEFVFMVNIDSDDLY